MAIEFNTTVDIEQGTSFADLFEDTTGDATWFRLWTGKLDDDGNIVEGDYVDVGTDGSGWVKASELADLEVGEDQVGHNTFSVQPWNEDDGHGEWFFEAGAMEFPPAPEAFTFSIVEDDITGDVTLDQLITYENIPEGVAEEDVWFKFTVDGEPIETEYGRGWVRASDLADETFSAEYVGKELTVEASSPEDFEIPAAQSWTVSGYAPADTLELTAEDDYVAPSDADMPEGYAYQETDDGNNLIKAVVSSLSSERTLNEDDIIDGGEGDDALSVSMKGNFSGFSDDGGMENVEMVELTSDSSIDRTFDATGVEDVEQYVLKAEESSLSLENLIDAESEIKVDGLESGQMSISYDSEAELDDATQAVVLNDVGSESAVQLDVADVPELSLTINGENEVDLSNVEAEDITVAGEGSLVVSEVSEDLETLDASDVSGDVEVDVTGSDGMTSVMTGAGDDEMTASTSSLKKNAEIDGGDGDNQLNLGGSGTVQYNMANVQTVALGAFTSKFNFSAKETSGLENLVATDDFDQTAVFSSMSTADVSYTLQDESAGTITSDNSGASTVNAVASADADEDNLEETNTSLNMTDAEAVTVNVEEYMEYAGEISANKADSLEVNADGNMFGEIQVNSATSGTFTTGEEVVDVQLVAGDMTDLNITAAGDVWMYGDTDLSSLESLTVQTSGSFGTGAELESLASAEFTGSGQVYLDNTVGNLDQDYDLDITAAGLSNPEEEDWNAFYIAGMEVGEGQSITVDASEVLGDVHIGYAAVDTNEDNELTGNININLDGAAESANIGYLSASEVAVEAEGLLGHLVIDNVNADEAVIVGSELGENEINVQAHDSIEVTGGIEDDYLSAAGFGTDDGDPTVANITGGLGADTFNLNGNLLATVTDFNVDDDVLAGDLSSYADATVWASADEAAAYLDDVLSLNASADDITLYDEAGDEADSGAFLVYDGDTYMMADGVNATLADVGGDDVGEIFDAGPGPQPGEAFFGLVDVNFPDEIGSGEGFEATVTVENAGDEAGTQTINTEIANADYSEGFEEDVTLDPGETQELTFSFDMEDEGEPAPVGEYDYFVSTEDETNGGSFTVTDSPQPEDYFLVTVTEDDDLTNFDADEIRADEEVDDVYFEFDDAPGQGSAIGVENFSEGDKIITGFDLDDEGLLIEGLSSSIDVAFGPDMDTFENSWNVSLKDQDAELIEDVNEAANVEEQIDLIGTEYGEDWIETAIS